MMVTWSEVYDAYCIGKGVEEKEVTQEGLESAIKVLQDKLDDLKVTKASIVQVKVSDYAQSVCSDLIMKVDGKYSHVSITSDGVVSVNESGLKVNPLSIVTKYISTNSYTGFITYMIYLDCWDDLEIAVVMPSS